MNNYLCLSYLACGFWVPLSSQKVISLSMMMLANSTYDAQFIPEYRDCCSREKMLLLAYLDETAPCRFHSLPQLKKCSNSSSLLPCLIY